MLCHRSGGHHEQHHSTDKILFHVGSLNDDWNHGGYNRNGDNNININVENFNKISGQRLTDANRTWQ
ncbi:hypothetical protein EGM92_24260, partial [Enterobacter cloacae]